MTVPFLWIAYLFSLTLYVLMKMFIAIGNRALTLKQANVFNTFLIPSYVIPVSMCILTLLFRNRSVLIINVIFAILMGLVVVNDFFGDMRRKSLIFQTAAALVFTFIIAVVLVYFSITRLMV